MSRSLPEPIDGFEIKHEIGRGAMGVVYLAEDLTLGRDVALKILSETHRDDPAHLERFRREARALAALNHPNVATIHSLLDVRDRVVLVMEHVPGESLDRRVGLLPFRSVVRYARQIASGLEFAHAHGIVHRDLKPANVMITPLEQVKLLDFGLAKRGAGLAGGEKPTTQVGEILGTPGYMSPEQVEGKSVDHRADVWAFGCLLFECLVGRLPYAGSTAYSILAQTLEHDPDLAPLDWVSEMTPGLRTLIEHCLTRDPGARASDMGQIRERLGDEIAVVGLPTDVRMPVVTGAGLSTTPNNLPIAASKLVGRAEARRRITALLDANRLVNVVGFGGTGKTRLATELGRELSSTYLDGVWLVSLDDLIDESELVPVVCKTMRLTDQAGLVEQLQHRRHLLILDNCEHLRDACATFLKGILTVDLRSRVLATSREPLGLSGEQIYRLPQLDVPHLNGSATMADVEECEAVTLFVQRARSAQDDFTLTPDNWTHVLDICRRVDGSALGIELAAARVPVLSPRQLSERLSGDLSRVLVGRGSDLPERHRTLARLVSWSYANLNDREQKVLEMLSVFVGGWTLDAAEAVCTTESIESWEILDILGSLIDKSLVERVIHPLMVNRRARYRLLQIVREEVRAQAAPETLADAAVRHCEYYVSLTADPNPTKWPHGYSSIDPDEANYRLALETAVAREHPGQASMLIALGWRSFAHGDHRSMLGYADRAFALGVSDEVSTGVLHYLAGTAHCMAGRTEEAVSHLDRAMEITADPDLGELSIDIIQNWSIVTNVDRAELVERYARLVAETRAVSTNQRAKLLNNYIALLLESGDYDRAREAITECLAAARAGDYPQRLPYSLNAAAVIAFHDGQLDEARSALVESAQLSRRIRHDANLRAALVWLARVLSTQDEPEAAATSLGMANTVDARLDAPFPHEHDNAVARERIECTLGTKAFQARFEAGRSASDDDVDTFLRSLRSDGAAGSAAGART